jgi:hypothetical protein
MRFVRSEHTDYILILGLCFAAAPALIGRLVTWLLYFYPGAPDSHYIVVILATFGLAAGIGARAFPWGIRLRLRAGVGVLAATCFGVLLASLVFGAPNADYLQKLYTAATDQWNPAASGWAGIMPTSAFVLLAAILAACWAPSRLPPNSGDERPRLVDYAAEICLGSLVLACLFSVAVLIIRRPLYENDALQYFKVAAMMYADKSVAHYPVIPAAPDGSYFSSGHPLGHYGLLIWTYMIAGDAVPGPGKVSALMECVATLVALWILLREQGTVVALIAMVLLLTTPAYTEQLLACGIDSGRIALFLAAVVALAWAARDNSVVAAIAAGVVAGLALNSHSETGMLVPFAIVAIMGAVSPSSLGRRASLAVVIGAVAFAVGGERYVLNMIQFGSPLQNDHVLWRLVPKLDYRGWRAGLAPRRDLLGRLSYGPLLGFTNWYYFGLTWWLAAAALVFRRFNIAGDPQLRAVIITSLVSLLLLCGYFGLTSQSELLLNNYRYVLCLQALIVPMAGLLLGKRTSSYAQSA